MRKIVSLFAFAVMAMFMGAALPQAASAQDGRYGGGNDRRYERDELPSGGYQQTCRDIRVDNGRLSASCRGKYGGWNYTSLNLRDCRGGTVENHDGRLVCVSGYGGNGGYGNNGRDDDWGNGGYGGGYGSRDLPPGGYRDTCRDIRLSRNILSAYCETKEGRWNYTTLDMRDCRYGNVENKRGVLVCRR